MASVAVAVRSRLGNLDQSPEGAVMDLGISLDINALASMLILLVSPGVLATVYIDRRQGQNRGREVDGLEDRVLERMTGSGFRNKIGFSGKFI